MISWAASKVMWEKYVGLAVCGAQKPLLLGGYQRRRTPSRTPVYAFLNTSRAHTEASHKKNHSFLP